MTILVKQLFLQKVTLFEASLACFNLAAVIKIFSNSVSALSTPCLSLEQLVNRNSEMRLVD